MRTLDEFEFHQDVPITRYVEKCHVLVLYSRSSDPRELYKIQVN